MIDGFQFGFSSLPYSSTFLVSQLEINVDGNNGQVVKILRGNFSPLSIGNENFCSGFGNM